MARLSACRLKPLLLVEYDRGLRLLVDTKREDIGSGIVSNNIEIIFSSCNVGQIKLRRQDTLFAVVGTRKYLAQRIDDATSSTREDCLRVIPKGGIVVLRIITPPGKLITGEDEAASFQRNMLHGCNPAISSIGSRSAVELDPFGIHRHTQQGHIVFPADDSSQSSQWGLEDRQSGAIAEAPDEPFRSGGHKLAMLPQIAPIG